MSTSARICTCLFGSLPFTAVFEVAAYAGAHAAGAAQPPTWVIAAGGFPQVIAAVLVVAILADRPKPQPDNGPAYGYLPPGQARRAVQTGRKELVR